jgi:hypothetical protein
MHATCSLFSLHAVHACKLADMVVFTVFVGDFVKDTS